jgi:hypothetical protein
MDEYAEFTASQSGLTLEQYIDSRPIEPGASMSSNQGASPDISPDRSAASGDDLSFVTDAALPVARFDRQSAEPWTAGESAAESDDGPGIPEFHVFVRLVDSREQVESAMETVLTRKIPQYREIAEHEVERGFWWYECQRRAADHRPRGPG